MSTEITLDKEVFKALAGDTRIAVLKALLLRRKTQSELAKELKVSAPTVKEHLDILRSAGLVREIDDGHKWKYIELTVKGKALLQPEDKRILVLLGSSLVGILGAGYFLAQRFALSAGENAAVAQDAFATKMVEAGSEIAPAALPLAADEASRAAVDMSSQLLAAGFYFEGLVLMVSLLVFGVSIGMWIKHTF